MDPTDPDNWQEYRSRPAWVRRHRDELQAATGLAIPRNLAELQDWLDRKQGVVTRKLRELAEEHSADDDPGGEA